MAQLVAHLLCKQGVTGSSPVSSTFYPQPDGCGFLFVSFINPYGAKVGLKDKKSWSEPDLSALRCEKVWFKVVGGQL